MKEIKIVQNDDGAVSIESTDADGNIVNSPVESIEEAIEQIKGEFGMDSMESEVMPGEDMGGNEPVAATKGKKLEDNIPMPGKDKQGMNPKKKADWSDYAAM